MSVQDLLILPGVYAISRGGGGGKRRGSGTSTTGVPVLPGHDPAGSPPELHVPFELGVVSQHLFSSSSSFIIGSAC